MVAPVLIILAVLAVGQDLAFDGNVPTQHPDVLPIFLSGHCLLGESLRAGHVPAWDPFTMAGAPFASDPQSGWGSILATLLYGLLPCGTALTWFIVAQPLLAGLGLYAFLRSESLSPAAAAVGGLGLALPMMGSLLSLSLPLSAALAWSAVLLAAVSRYVRATGWSPRLAWAALAAAAWGQIAAAHLSHGLLVGTGVAAAYMLARSASDVRTGRQSARAAIGHIALLGVASVAVNLAILLPRFALVGRTTVGQGYMELEARSLALTGLPGALGRFAVTSPGWILELAHAPGLYLGAAVLLLALASWTSGRFRPLVIAFVAYGALFYLLGQRTVATAVASRPSAGFVAGLFAHEPIRFRYAALIALPVLAAVGMHAWLEHPAAWRTVVSLGSGVVIWALLPAALGKAGSFSPLFGAGLLGTGVALILSARRPRLAVLLPFLVAVELVISGLDGQAEPPGVDRAAALPPRRAARLDPERYLTPGTIASTMRAEDGGRYISLDPRGWMSIGYHVRQRPTVWPLLAMQQGRQLGLEAAQGANSVQLLRFWSFIRAVEPKPILYNVSYFRDPPPLAFDLLQVGWVVGPAEAGPPVGGARSVATEGRWALWRLPSVPPRASLVRAWTVERTPEGALDAVTAEGFDPRSSVVLERDPGLQAEPVPATGGLVTYRSLGAQAARIGVTSPGPAVLLVRTAHDPNWHATVDGRPAPILVANGFLQAVAVPEGRHTVILRYDDHWIGYGLAGTAVALWLLLGAAFVVAGRSESPSRRSEGQASAKSTTHRADTSSDPPTEEAGPAPVRRSRPRSLTIVIPIHNEERILRGTVEAIHAGALDFGLDAVEVILAENGSRDGTEHLARTLAAEIPGVRVVALDRADYGAALRAGVLPALGDAIASFDADYFDLQFARRALELDADIVVASKGLEGSVDARTLLRRVASQVFGWLVRRVLGVSVSETHGMKVFHRLAVQPLAMEVRSTQDLFDTELVARAERARLSIRELPVRTEEMRHSRSGILRRIPRTVWGLFRIRRMLARQPVTRSEADTPTSRRR